MASTTTRGRGHLPVACPWCHIDRVTRSAPPRPPLSYPVLLLVSPFSFLFFTLLFSSQQAPRSKLSSFFSSQAILAGTSEPPLHSSSCHGVGASTRAIEKDYGPRPLINRQQATASGWVRHALPQSWQKKDLHDDPKCKEFLEKFFKKQDQPRHHRHRI